MDVTGLIHNKDNVAMACHRLFPDSGCKISRYPFSFMRMKDNLSNIARASESLSHVSKGVGAKNRLELTCFDSHSGVQFAT